MSNTNNTSKIWDWEFRWWKETVDVEKPLEVLFKEKKYCMHSWIVRIKMLYLLEINQFICSLGWCSTWRVLPASYSPKWPTLTRSSATTRGCSPATAVSCCVPLGRGQPGHGEGARLLTHEFRRQCGPVISWSECTGQVLFRELLFLTLFDTIILRYTLRTGRTGTSDTRRALAKTLGAHDRQTKLVSARHKARDVKAAATTWRRLSKSSERRWETTIPIRKTTGDLLQ